MEEKNRMISRALEKFMRLIILMIAIASWQNCYAADSINIYVSILPQKYLVERIAGDHATVSSMLQSDHGHGHDHGVYNPSTKQMQELKKAQLYFQIGMLFERALMSTIKESYHNLTIIECCAQLNLPTAEGDMKADLHVWTSPVNAKHIADTIKTAMTTALPQHKQTFNNNYEQLIMELEALERYIKNALAKSQNRHIITYHAAWGHYAQAYGLKQIPIALEGREISAKYLSQLIEFAKSKKIQKIFVQPHFNKSYAAVIAKEIGGKVIELDPLAEDYINNLYYVTDIIFSD